MTLTAHTAGCQTELRWRFARLPIRLAVAAAVAASLAMPSLSVAEQRPETPVTAFHELPLLVNLGDRVTVTEDTGRELEGKLVDLSPSALSVLVDGTRYDLHAGGIATIRQPDLDSISNGVLLGLLTGAGLAAVGVALTAYMPDAAEYLGAAAIFGGAGAGIGAVADSLRTGSQVVYEKSRTSVGLSVAPVLSRDRKGIAVSLGF